MQPGLAILEKEVSGLTAGEGDVVAVLRRVAAWAFLGVMFAYVVEQGPKPAFVGAQLGVGGQGGSVPPGVGDPERGYPPFFASSLACDRC